MNFNDKLKQAEKFVAEDNYLAAYDLYCELSYERQEDKSLLDKALFLLSRITEANYDFEPQTAIQFLFRGVAKCYKNEIKNSIVDYDKAISLDPKLVNAYYFKAISLRELGQNALAIEEANRAIAVTPNADSYDELAENYFRLGNIKECLLNHKKATEIGPNNSRIWFNYAVHLGKAEMYANSLIAFQKVQELDPKYPKLDIAMNHIMSKLAGL
jgi:tetratricopeptide (TPR) repeat protein